MAAFDNLAREYEARRFPAARRLDLHGEGPLTARDRALHWIQSHAHEAPGSELLLIVERGGRPGARPGPVRTSVEQLLKRLQGGLIEWWSPFASGSLVVQVAVEPRLVPLTPLAEPLVDPTDGRTPETAGAALPPPELDIPDELLPLAQQVAELRRSREGLSLGLFEVVLRRVWIDAQTTAMGKRLSFAEALERLAADEQALPWDED